MYSTNKYMWHDCRCQHPAKGWSSTLTFQCLYCKNGGGFHQVLTYFGFPDSCPVPPPPCPDLTFPLAQISNYTKSDVYLCCLLFSVCTVKHFGFLTKFDVFLTVHHVIELFHQPILMHNALSPLSTSVLCRRLQRAMIPDAVWIQFFLLKMGTLMLETCRG